MVIPVKTSKADFLSSYVQLANAFTRLAVRECDILVEMVRNSRDGVCDSRAMKKVRETLNLTHAYMSPMLRRIRDKGAITFERTEGSRGIYRIHPLFIPPAETVDKLTFKFEFE